MDDEQRVPSMIWHLLRLLSAARGGYYGAKEGVRAVASFNIPTTTARWWWSRVL